MTRRPRKLGREDRREVRMRRLTRPLLVALCALAFAASAAAQSLNPFHETVDRIEDDRILGLWDAEGWLTLAITQLHDGSYHVDCVTGEDEGDEPRVEAAACPFHMNPDRFRLVPEFQDADAQALRLDLEGEQHVDRQDEAGPDIRFPRRVLLTGSPRQNAILLAGHPGLITWKYLLTRPAGEPLPDRLSASPPRERGHS